MERKTKGSFRSESLANLSCELDWCYLASFLKDDAYKYNKMDMKYRKWSVFLLQRPKRNIYIYIYIYIHIFEISTSIICGWRQWMQKCIPVLRLWLIQRNISCLSNSIIIHISLVFCAHFIDLVIFTPFWRQHFSTLNWFEYG